MGAAGNCEQGWAQRTGIRKYFISEAKTGRKEPRPLDPYVEPYARYIAQIGEKAMTDHHLHHCTQKEHRINGLFVMEYAPGHASKDTETMLMIPGACHGWRAFEKWGPFFAQRSRIACPVIVVAGAADRSPVHNARAIADFYDADCVIIPDCGHDVMLDNAWRTAAEEVERQLKKML